MNRSKIFAVVAAALVLAGCGTATKSAEPTSTTLATSAAPTTTAAAETTNPTDEYSLIKSICSTYCFSIEGAVEQMKQCDSTEVTPCDAEFTNLITELEGPVSALTADATPAAAEVLESIDATKEAGEDFNNASCFDPAMYNVTCRLAYMTAYTTAGTAVLIMESPEIAG